MFLEEENYTFLRIDLAYLAISRIVAQTVEKFGRLDVLVFDFIFSAEIARTMLGLQVNNAGVLEMGTIETTSLEQYDR